MPGLGKKGRLMNLNWVDGRSKRRRVVVDGKLVCSKCGKLKPVEEFPRDKNAYSGRCSHCKTCRKNIGNPLKNIEEITIYNIRMDYL